MPNTPSPYFAAIDLGSNSFHLLVARHNNGLLDIIDREKDMVQLGKGLTASGRLSQAVQQRALVCLGRFGERLRHIPPAQIRALGTKTLRSACHAEAFIQKAEQALGHKIEIISGFEEARLVYQGLAHCVANDNNRRLVLDIGGGSTECIIGQDHTPSLLESLNIGCISGSQLLPQGQPITAKHLHSVYLAACAHIETILPAYLGAGWDIAYGTSGTFRALAECLAPQDGGAVIRKASLMHFIETLSRQGKIALKSLPSQRRAVLPAGAAIVWALFDQFQLDTIHIADATLKEGVIYDLIGRLAHEDARHQAVAKLQQHYRIDTRQAQQVQQLALQLWQQLKTPSIPALSRTKILSFAAQLHEIGLAISHSGHHHHGHYILKHSDLAGFSRYEQAILADIVRCHRKKMLPEGVFTPLDPKVQQALMPLVVCLRLAVLLHRSRQAFTATLQLTKQGSRYRLIFPKGWLAAHPLTQAGLQQEKSYFEDAGLNLIFKEASPPL